MLYRNEPENLKLAVRKYIIKMSLIYGFGIIFNFVLFFFCLPKIRPDLEQVKYIFLFVFPALALFSAFIVYINSKKIKDIYSDHSFEITDGRIIVVNNKIKNEYNLNELKKIEQIDKDKYALYMKNNNRIFTSEFLENKEKLYEELSSLKEIQKSSKNKIFSILSIIFCVGFFTSRFIPNLWIYIFFALGFLVTSIISVYQNIFTNNKLWVKIYLIVFYLFIDTSIIYALYKVFKYLIG